MPPVIAVQYSSLKNFSRKSIIAYAYIKINAYEKVNRNDIIREIKR